MSVLLNTQATLVTIQRGKKLVVLPLNKKSQSMDNLKTFKVIECPLYVNKECILKRINELKSF